MNLSGHSQLGQGLRNIMNESVKEIFKVIFLVPSLVVIFILATVICYVADRKD